jgi:hypothetical protein
MPLSIFKLASGSPKEALLGSEYLKITEEASEIEVIIANLAFC